MIPDWFVTILPVLNAAGIPLLSIGMIILVITYQKALKIHEDTTTRLQEENKKLRERAESLDEFYADSLAKMRVNVATSNQEIGNLQSSQISLLAEITQLKILITQTGDSKRTQVNRSKKKGS